MPSTPPIRFSRTKILMLRAAKRVIWPHPVLYYPFGIWRKRGNVLRKDWDLFMGGYPRSANTFSKVAFLAANPGTKVLTHRHVPTFVLYLVKRGVPGLVLIRRPLDASVSWAIYQNLPLEQTVAYWNDYYTALLPVLSELFLVQFEDVTKDFGAIIRGLNTRFGTSYVPFEHTPENAAQCFRLAEVDNVQAYRPGGGLIESKTCRPSSERRIVKETHLEKLEQSSFLRDELARANALYDKFVHQKAKGEMAMSTRLSPAPPSIEDSRTFQVEATGA